MDKVIGALICALIVIAAVWLMRRSWRRRTQRDQGIGGYPLPPEEGEALVDLEALYVASTPREEPLERLAIPGLAFRGTARIRIEAAGLTIRVAGEEPVFIPAGVLSDAETAGWAIDRGVEPEGLVVVRWRAREDGSEDGVAVDSYLRARYEGDRDQIIEAIGTIAASGEAAHPASAPEPPESES
ncbi:hypothetical protein [Agromyces archimandritae]|uniref:PH domain-containing protein n=1 Tax=Agromyces archimandritae TaxID=2781962 RepID=A0A975FMH4_9MICO|nr:hypothetical protein [Agromyces archimandritae]QTX04619.1 hypothetical protein G127AT_15445 [Agromyces archimandritae]